MVQRGSMRRSNRLANKFTNSLDSNNLVDHVPLSYSSSSSSLSSSTNNLSFKRVRKKRMVSSAEPLPEDHPFTRESKGKADTTSMGPPSASKNPARSISFPSLPTQAINEPIPAGSSGKKKLDMPIHKDLPISSKDNIPQNTILGEKEEVEAGTSTLLGANVTCVDSLPPHFLNICQAIESAYVPKECFVKKDEEYQELALELALTKSRVEELEHQLELSEAKRVKSENLAIETMKNLEESLEDLKSSSEKICDLYIKNASEARSQMLTMLK